MFKKRGTFPIVIAVLYFIIFQVTATYAKWYGIERTIVFVIGGNIIWFASKRIETNMLGPDTPENTPSDNSDLLDDKAPKD